MERRCLAALMIVGGIALGAAVADALTGPSGVSTTPEDAHRRYESWFARMPGFGGQRMPVLPQLPTRLDLAGQIYRLEKPDLVGLDSPGGPRVYLATEQPFNVVTLTNATLRARFAKRDLDDFETNAVARLRKSDRLVLSPEPDHLGDQRRMMGPLRASAACAKCHSCAPGTLLGAFSYRLTPELKTADLRGANSPAGQIVAR